jgi:hypothetical protein
MIDAGLSIHFRIRENAGKHSAFSRMRLRGMSLQDSGRRSVSSAPFRTGSQALVTTHHLPLTSDIICISQGTILQYN